MAEYKISLEEIKDICEDTKDLEAVGTMAELKDFFNRKATKGLWLRDIMQKVGVEKDRVPLEKDERISWILKNVTVEGLTEEVKATPEPAGQAEEETPALVEAPSEIPVEKCKLDLSSVQAFLRRVDKKHFKAKNGELDITPAKLFEQVSIEYQDNFCVVYQPGYYEGLVALLKRNENEAVAIGHLQREQGKYHILLEKKDIAFGVFGSNKKYRLALFDSASGAVLEKGKLEPSDAIEFQGTISTVECEIDYKPMEQTKNTLCIDFGTSNTSAGSYGLIDRENSDIELVSFTDVTTAEMKETKLYPTMVYVDDCSNPKQIGYLFGYEAKKRVMDKGYDTEASVFLEIKRWIGSLDTEEELKDEEGNTVTVKRREIIKAYMLHVIELSQQYFKVKFQKLHLSAPIKLKEKFFKEMDRMLGKEGYQILRPASSVDEGIAIVYNSISRLISQNRMKEGENPNIMILDCGGGTTDLARCEVSTKELDTGRKLEISTKFVNGNSNFGGNNITFRIMQLLKIKLADEFAPELMQHVTLKELIPFEESEILTKVEEEYEKSKGKQYNSDTKNEIYQTFVEAYQRAEQSIPTVFTDNERFPFAGQRQKIKRNYYYLWQLAERIKIKFYEEDVVSVDFERDSHRPLEFDRMENYYLYVAEGDNLVKKENPADKIEITINEIRKVLCGDIYGLLYELLATQDWKNESYPYYKLAGQSCKINLFMELMKEFIPGRMLRMSSAAKEETETQNKGSIRLKLDCIRGSIAYIRDKECGKIKPEMKSEKPKLIYDVYINKVDVPEQILYKDEAKGDSSQIGFVLYSTKATKAEFLIKNSFGELERKFVIELSREQPKDIKLDQMFQEIKENALVEEKALTDLQVDIIRVNPQESDENDFVRLVFAIPSKEGYGMNIYQVKKKIESGQEKYSWWKTSYENYENESTKSFFDGRR